MDAILGAILAMLVLAGIFLAFCFLFRMIWLYVVIFLAIGYSVGELGSGPAVFLIGMLVASWLANKVVFS